MALLTGGAQACVGDAGQFERREHACCPDRSTPAPQPRCHDCDIIPAVPKPAIVMPAADAIDMVWQSPLAVNAGADHMSDSQFSATDDAPIPSKLRDLHHLSIQLTE